MYWEDEKFKGDTKMERGEISQALFVFSYMGYSIITLKIIDKRTQDIIYRTFDLNYKPRHVTSLENYIADVIDSLTYNDHDDYTIIFSPGYDIPCDDEDDWSDILDDARDRYRTRVERSKYRNDAYWG